MTVKENRTILSRATIRAIAITALVAVAAVFSTQNTGVAFGSCPYTPSPGDQADLWLDMGSEDTYFTDAEWPGLEVKTFSLKGPFRGEVNIRTYTGWGLTTSTTSSEISCTTAQSYTAIKNTESMPIYLKRCNWGDHTSLQFGITHERKCILNGTQSYIYPMLITESDMEGTPLTYTTGGEDGRGTQNTATTTETTHTPQTPQQPIDTCIAQARQVAEAVTEEQEPTEDDGYITPVITDVNNIPSDRNEDTLNTWNEVRQNEGLLRVRFYHTRDGRYLTTSEVEAEFGEQQEGETNLEWKRRVGITWASAASGYGLTQRQQDAAARRESHQEYKTRIGAAFIGWENDDPRNGEQQYRAPDGSTVTYQELMQQYGFPLQDKTNHPFYLALAGCQEGETTNTNGVVCNTNPAAASNGISLTQQLRDDETIMGRWTGPNRSSSDQLTDWLRTSEQMNDAMRTARDTTASQADKQAAADLLWSASIEFRSSAVRIHVNAEGKQTTQGAGSRAMSPSQWMRLVIDISGLRPGPAVADDCAPWKVFVDSLNVALTGEEARERYGGMQGSEDITRYMNRNRIHIIRNTGGLNECLVGAVKHYDGPVSEFTITSQTDGSPLIWITEEGRKLTWPQATELFGFVYQETEEQWAARNGLTAIEPEYDEHTIPPIQCSSQ